MMILCVTLVSIGGILDIEDESDDGQKVTDEEKEEKLMGLILAVSCAAVTGFLFSMNAITI